jgi:RHS repeat-associated protein
VTGVKQGGTVIATYVYDALDRRIEFQEGGSTTWTVYNGTNPDAAPYGDFNSSGTLLTRYVSGPGMVNGAAVDELLARTSSGGTSAWYLTDKLDSVRDVVSSSGSALDHVVYDSFGNITTETNGSNGDRLKFAGMEYERTTGQYYDRARYYVPVTGRFIAQDPLGFSAGDPDLYRYATNCPTNQVDPSGKDGAGSVASPDMLTTVTTQESAQQGYLEPSPPMQPWTSDGNLLKEIPIPGTPYTLWDLLQSPRLPDPTPPGYVIPRPPRVPGMPEPHQFPDGNWYYQDQQKWIWYQWRLGQPPVGGGYWWYGVPPPPGPPSPIPF